MKPRMKVLIDMDSTIADLLNPWLTLYNEEYGDNLGVEDVVWDIARKAKCGSSIFKYLETDIFRHLKPFPGAVEGVHALFDAGHELYIVSAPPPFAPHVGGDKILWLKEHLPFLSSRQVIMTSAKHLLRADVLIDDAPIYVDNYRHEWPKAYIAGIAFPYNRGCRSFDLRAEDYRHTEQAWEAIVAGVEEFARCR